MADIDVQIYQNYIVLTCKCGNPSFTLTGLGGNQSRIRCAGCGTTYLFTVNAVKEDT